MSIEFKVNGKRVRPEEFGEALGQKALAVLERQLNQKLRNARCPVHRRPPTVKLIQRSGRTRPKISTCCKEFEKAVDIKWQESGEVRK